MDIGILSMQRIYNYGSWMQAYALKNIIKDIVDASSVQFVDYHIEKPVFSEKTDRKKYRANYWKQFISERITDFKVSSQAMPNDYFMHIYNFKHKYQPELFDMKWHQRNYNPQLDALIIGSDEVFNCTQQNVDVGYSKELFGEGIPAKKKITYAASFGNTTLEKIETLGIDKEIAKWIGKLDDISVRDNNSQKIIRMLSGIEAQVHLDPVLIYDFSKELEIEIEEGLQDPYMIVYAYSNRLKREEEEAIASYARKRGLKIYCISGEYSIADKMIYDSPLNIIRYFKNAECVVTDTFHGTIFSIINHKPFATFVRKSELIGYGNQEKLEDLLQRLLLTSRIVAEPREIAEVLSDEINYTEVDKIIYKERISSKQYLKKILM